MVHAVTYSKICCWVRLPRILQQRLPILQDGTNSALFQRCIMSILLWSSLSPCLVAADIAYSTACMAAIVHRLLVPSDPQSSYRTALLRLFAANLQHSLGSSAHRSGKHTAFGTHACAPSQASYGSSGRLSHRRGALFATVPFGSCSVLTFSTALARPMVWKGSQLLISWESRKNAESVQRDKCTQAGERVYHKARRPRSVHIPPADISWFPWHTICTIF